MLNRVLYRSDSFDSELHLSGICRLRRPILRHPKNPHCWPGELGLSHDRRTAAAYTFRTEPRSKCPMWTQAQSSAKSKILWAYTE